jgi:hypothetical protein
MVTARGLSRTTAVPINWNGPEEVEVQKLSELPGETIEVSKPITAVLPETNPGIPFVALEAVKNPDSEGLFGGDSTCPDEAVEEGMLLLAGGRSTSVFIPETPGIAVGEADAFNNEDSDKAGDSV